MCRSEVAILELRFTKIILVTSAERLSRVKYARTLDYLIILANTYGL